MRPESIQQFGYFYLGSVGLAILNMALSLWAGISTLGPMMQSGSVSPAHAMIAMVAGGLNFLFAVVVPVILWYFAARRAAEWAKWIIVGLGAFGALRLLFLLFLLGVLIISQEPTPQVLWLSMSIGIFTEILHLAGIAFLFFADAREYYALKGQMPSYEHEEVFG